MLENLGSLSQGQIFILIGMIGLLVVLWRTKNKMKP